MYIYVIQQKDTNNYKIGVSSNPDKRLRELQIANAMELILFKTVKVSDKINAFKIESILHYYFKRLNKQGEWFLLQENELNEIEPLAQKADKNLIYLKEMSSGKNSLGD